MKWPLISCCCSIIIILSCNTYTQGERIYQLQCANCHGEKGEGLANLYPAMRTSVIVNNNVFRIPCIIKNGKFSIDNKGNKVSEMPAIPDMNEIEMTNLLNFLQKEFTEKRTAVTVDSVELWLAECN